MTSPLLLLAGLLTSKAYAADILYCVDSTIGTDAMAEALAVSAHTVTSTTDMEGACEAGILSHSYDLVIVAIQDSSYSMPFFTAWMASGGRTIVQDWTLPDNAATAAAYGLTIEGENLDVLSGFGGSIDASLPASITLDNPGWGTYSMSVSGVGSTLGSFEDGNASIVRAGDVIFNGFLTDTAEASQLADMEQLYANEIAAVLADDLDGDGYYDGVDDCDDSDGAVHPGATETWYDGTDSDCSGGSDYDQDSDGDDSDAYGGGDCDDTDATVASTLGETWYNGVDNDCDGSSDYDQDGDGEDSDAFSGADCDDTDATVNSTARETYYDGVDQDCNGDSDYDGDGDGHDNDAYGGDDCDDASFFTHPGRTESWYDGDDNDCDGGSDYDQDGDGEDSDAYGGTDCDDLDAGVNTDALEITDGADNNCDGTIDELGPDADNDGVSDADEAILGTNPSDPDTDGDGMEDGDELVIDTDPWDRDTDDDGLSDGAEYNTYFCDPLDRDTDDDLIGDATEVGRDYDTIHTEGSFFVPDEDPSTTTDPNDADTDDDGITDGNEDPDRNGAQDAGETDPFDADSDDDWMQDGTEIGLAAAQSVDTNQAFFVSDEDSSSTTDPLKADTDSGGVEDGVEDLNHDGAIDTAECDPNNGTDDDNCADDDGDGLSNVAETAGGTDPQNPDTDGDGIGDGIEVFTSTDPLDSDTDDDLLNDGAEDANHNGEVDAGESDPRLTDTDGGGVEDGAEYWGNTDPLDPSDDVVEGDTGEAPVAEEYVYAGRGCDAAGGMPGVGAGILGLAVVAARRRRTA